METAFTHEKSLQTKKKNTVWVLSLRSKDKQNINTQLECDTI